MKKLYYVFRLCDMEDGFGSYRMEFTGGFVKERDALDCIKFEQLRHPGYSKYTIITAYDFKE